MSEAATGGTRSIRFRMVNRTTVIPEQVSLCVNFLFLTYSMSLVAKHILMIVYNLYTILQSLLFLRRPDEDGTGGTLSGNKADVYVLLKIFKIIFDAIITSFSLKYSVDRALADKKYEEEPIGSSLLRVVRYCFLFKYTVSICVHP